MSVGVFCRRLLTDYHRVAVTLVDKRLLQRGTAGALVAAVHRVISDPGYSTRISKLSARLKAQPGTPLSRVRLAVLSISYHARIFISAWNMWGFSVYPAVWALQEWESDRASVFLPTLP